jgi:GNAT superfamily N-acetyltransferase
VVELVTMSDDDDRLTAHLRSWLGAWPPDQELVVATCDLRTSPGWDGEIRPVGGVTDPERGTVLSVPPNVVDRVHSLDDLPAALRKPKGRVYSGVFRWTMTPTDLPDAGTWLPVEDPRVPDWLKPFGGLVLMAFDDAGDYVAGVGIKRHDPHGHELAVVTEEGHRQAGLARRLVAQAARKVLADGAVPTYLHADSNVASAHVADAAGFPDKGWRILGFG